MAKDKIVENIFDSLVADRVSALINSRAKIRELCIDHLSALGANKDDIKTVYIAPTNFVIRADDIKAEYNLYTVYTATSASWVADLQIDL